MGVKNRSPIARWAAVGLVALLLLLSGCARRGNPAEPSDESGGYRLVATLPIEGYAEDVEVYGDLALLAAGQGGLVLVDVSDPAAPAWLGMGPTAYSATGCAYAPTDSLGYVTSGTQGAAVYDLRDPTAPEEVTYCQGMRTRDVVVVETIPGELHHVYGADGEGDFRIWEVRYYEGHETWFANQVYHGFTSGNAQGVCLHGDLALLAMEEIGLAIFDVSDIGSASELGGVDTPGEARAVAADGDYAYVADWRMGLQVIDISDPADPEIVGSAETVGNAEGIFYRDGTVYVADHTGGLRVFDVTDPTTPEPAGYLETPYANGVFVTDSYVFVADRDWGLVVAEEE